MFDPFANEEEKEVSVQPFQKLIHNEGGEEYLVVICNSIKINFACWEKVEVKLATFDGDPVLNDNTNWMSLST